MTGSLSSTKRTFIIPQRIILGVVCFFALFIAMGSRSLLSFAITRMVAKHNKTGVISNECPVENNNVAITITSLHYTNNSYEFDWSEQLQGLILASFYLGYVMTQVPGGLLASRFGGRYILLIAVFLNALLTLITPICVRIGGAHALIAIRIIIGMAEGLIVPSCGVLLSAWVPLRERSRISTFVYSGMQMGTIVASILSGYLLSAYAGWTPSYYVYSTFGIILSIFILVFCYSDPESHPFISETEKCYLLKEIGQLQRDKNQPSTPWKQLFTSIPVLAQFAAHFGFGFSLFLLKINLPKYMNDVLKFSILKNGIFSALPFLASWSFALCSAVAADFLINKTLMTITNVRKILGIISILAPTLFVLGASYAECDRMIAVICFTVGLGFSGSYLPGMKANILDLAPNYAGVVMAITNSIASVSGFIAPYVVGIFTPNALMKEWRTVFWINVGISIPCTLIYLIWASGELQSWNVPVEVNHKKSRDVSTPDVTHF